MTRSLRPFAVETRPLPPRQPSGPRLAAEPDVIGEIRDIACRLRDVPRAWLDSWQDVVNAMQREGGRLERLVERIETFEPVSGAGRIVRLTGKASRRGADGQMEMGL